MAQTFAQCALGALLLFVVFMFLTKRARKKKKIVGVSATSHFKIRPPDEPPPEEVSVQRIEAAVQGVRSHVPPEAVSL